MAAQVVGDDPELVGQVDELVPPQVVAERQSVDQDAAASRRRSHPRTTRPRHVVLTVVEASGGGGPLSSLMDERRSSRLRTNRGTQAASAQTRR